MKSRAVLAFFVVALSILGTACHTNEEAGRQEIPSEQDGLFAATEQERYETADEGVAILIENETDLDFEGDPAYSIEREIDGVWYTVDMRRDFPAMGFFVGAQSITTEFYPLEVVEEELTPGNYRIVLSFIQQTDEGLVGEEIYLAATFEIVD
ncbi:immunoglobulin-like domain-containing protein [Planomicrobium sp. YIM 101495]|uniref:immunoglobulin-like domain-containing protein n=1 Tax=Planomicrobium sp. YIM 101495 TaxID=2665160 RepID=UPI0012B94640|nr:immunoglobulin-like domain-containing protein [Planomicrobium sp. YIM 101495]MTD31392.1 hypothetical protein [Planomicrobium sp. YIM 101495]